MALELEYAGPEGEAARRAAGQALYDLNVKQYCCGGLNFGYFYDKSPLIAYDGVPAPGYTMDQFTPSTVPGCRTPHVWLDDGLSLDDAMDRGFTLLRFDTRVDVQALVSAAALRQVPLALLEVSSAQAAGPYRECLVLSRPELHVAWRGNSLPVDCLRLIDLIHGAC